MLFCNSRVEGLNLGVHVESMNRRELYNFKLSSVIKVRLSRVNEVSVY